MNLKKLVINKIYFKALFTKAEIDSLISNQKQNKICKTGIDTKQDNYIKISTNDMDNNRSADTTSVSQDDLYLHEISDEILTNNKKSNAQEEIEELRKEFFSNNTYEVDDEQIALN
jgi:hypothetical protein